MIDIEITRNMHSEPTFDGFLICGNCGKKSKQFIGGLDHIYCPKCALEQKVLKDIEANKNNSIDIINSKEYTKIVVETDEEPPKTIVEITDEEIFVAGGYRVRLTPKYGGKEITNKQTR